MTIGDSSTLPTWRRDLERALKRNRGDAHSRYFQLASVSADGSPRNRTVVFRGFAADSHDLLVISDDRAAKHTELLHNSAVAIAWYFSRSREQFRVVGNAVVATRDNDTQRRRQQLWSALSDPAKAQFFWPAPGAPVSSASQSTPSHDQSTHTAAPPDNFTVIAVSPVSVDHLQLTNPQRRFKSHWDGAQWLACEVNP